MPVSRPRPAALSQRIAGNAPFLSGGQYRPHAPTGQSPLIIFFTSNCCCYSFESFLWSVKGSCYQSRLALFINGKEIMKLLPLFVTLVTLVILSGCGTPINHQTQDGDCAARQLESPKGDHLSQWLATLTPLLERDLRLEESYIGHAVKVSMNIDSKGQAHPQIIWSSGNRWLEAAVLNVITQVPILDISCLSRQELFMIESMMVVFNPMDGYKGAIPD